MATLKRYPLNMSAIKELAEDLGKLQEALSTAPANIVANETQRAEAHFNAHLTRDKSARPSVITVASSVASAEKGKATGRLTATGKTEDTGFNILMAVEFGAGIVGVDGLSNTSYPELPYGTGTWPGQIHAFDYNGWLFPGKDGKWHRTYGTPATMPMHYTIEYVKVDMSRQIREEIRKWLT